MNKFLIATAAALIINAASANAATFGGYINNEGNAVITLDGDIIPGDSETFYNKAKQGNQQGYYISGIRLNSNGGAVSEGAKIAELIRTLKIATVVPNGKVCASACFIAFSAGTERWVSAKAYVGVHGASNQDGQETTGSAATTVLMARLVKAYGASDSIIGKMVTTPPSQMVWLSTTDLESMGTRITGRPAPQPRYRPANNDFFNGLFE